MIELDLQYFGGRGSSGGNAKESAMSAANRTPTLTSKPVENKASEKNSVEKTSTPTRQELDREPIGTVYMSNNGTLYVKQNSENAVNSDWTDITGDNRQGYGVSSEELSKRMQKLSFTKLPSNSSYKGAGNYMPTPSAQQKAATQRKASAPERQIKAIDRSLSNGSSMTKMGSGKAGQYVVDLSTKDASSKRLAKRLKSAGFKQVGNSRWVKNGV